MYPPTPSVHSVPMPMPMHALRNAKHESLKAELEERARIAEEWATSIVEPTQLYGQASGVFLWEGCLRLLQCCELDEPMVARKLIRCVPCLQPVLPQSYIPKRRFS